MPWTLGSEIHVDNLHARENVHIDGDPITLSALAEVLPGSDHAIGVGAMHFDPSTMKVSYSTSAAGIFDETVNITCERNVLADFARIA